MRVLALQLLAICQLASASPCKPSSSSGSVALSTSSVEATSAPVISSSTVADATDTSTTFFTESTAVSETETETATTQTRTEAISGTTTELASDSATSTILITTSSAEPTTTTTSASEPTNVLTNPDFESGTVMPWHPVGQFGYISISDEDTHSGDFSGYYDADSEDPVVLGVDHPIDSSLIAVDQEYTYSIWIKTIRAVACQTRKITCGAGGGYIKSEDWAGPNNEWTQFTMSCTWSEMFLEMGPSIQIRAECQSLEIYVDDAILVEAN